MTLSTHSPEAISFSSSRYFWLGLMTGGHGGELANRSSRSKLGIFCLNVEFF
uniref:Uncharacterized protein n=1 Tax=Rhizophora mucronata TaxID=61149 RepID=A0A2P2NY26_RHIMU